MPVRTAWLTTRRANRINDLESFVQQADNFTPRLLTAKLFIAEKLTDAGTAAP